MSQFDTELPRSPAAVGRPKKSNLDSARERIMEAARTLLRNGAGVTLQRRECATTANVTPALVSYYFREQHDLIEAAARPVVDEYFLRLRVTLSSDQSVPEKLRSIIMLFLITNLRYGKLLEQYASHVAASNRDPRQFMTEASIEIRDFFGLCMEHGYFVNTPPSFIQSFVWGACKTVAQNRELKTTAFGECVSDAQVAAREADLIIGILSSAHSSRSSNHEVIKS